tara:strand:- start:91 stop:579 length:489 start_codon:yes stop_codon:yes gene_type:complete
MAITQIAQKIKISFLCSIKKLFKLNLNKLGVFLSLFLFSCTSHLIQAKEIKPEAVKCGVSRAISETNFPETLTIKDKKFKKKLIEIRLDKTDVDYNLFVSIGLRGFKGFKLDFDKIIKDKNKSKIYFIETKPSKNVAGAAVPVYPYCLLKVKNLDRVEVFIK